MLAVKVSAALKQGDEVPAADVPAAAVPAADGTAADIPAADVPAADVPAADVPAADGTAKIRPLEDVDAADVPAAAKLATAIFALGPLIRNASVAGVLPLPAGGLTFLLPLGLPIARRNEGDVSDKLDVTNLTMSHRHWFVKVLSRFNGTCLRSALCTEHT